MANLEKVVPQFLVDDLVASLTFYQDRLGFRRDFVYEDFYASVSRDAASIHLKCAPKLEAERAHRKSHDHLDAHILVNDARGLCEEFVTCGVAIAKPPEVQPWGVLDFYIEDPDGYILCFSQAEPA
jgi:catechol 2,3-dioxygenase-like lactoylglutathione lyase family enzyme